MRFRPVHLMRALLIMKSTTYSLLSLFALAPVLKGSVEVLPLVHAEEPPPVQAEALTVWGSQKELLQSLEISLCEQPSAEVKSEDLSELFPSFQVNGSGAFSFNDTFSLRGLSNTPIFGGAAVALYIEDIPLSGPFSLPEDLSVFGAARLHYGPGQGSRYGRSAPGGLLQLSVVAKEGDGPSARLRAGLGSRKSVNASGLWLQTKGPATVTAGIAHSQRDGHIVNATTGQRIDTVDTWSGLVHLGYRASEKWRLSLTAFVQKANNGDQPMVPLFGGPFEVARENQGSTEGLSLNLGVSAAYEASWGRMQLSSSCTDWKLAPYLSVLSFGPAELLNDVRLKERSLNEELRFSSKQDSVLQWTGGLFWSRGETEGSFSRSFGPMTFEASAYEVVKQQVAAFGQISYPLGAGFELGAGLRAEGVRAVQERIERVPAPGSYKSLAESSAFLPRLSLSWRASSSTVVDLSLCSGFKPGGVSSFTGNAALSTFASERLVGLEAGLSSACLEGRLTYSFRAHLYNIHGYQIERSFATGSQSDDYLVVNAPEARSVGVEAGIQWAPHPLVRLSFGGSLNDTTLRDFTDPYTGISYKGSRAPYVPSSDLSLALALGGRTGLQASARASYTGRVYYTEAEEPLFSQAGHSLLSARLAYAWTRFTLAVHGENLGDRRYWRSIAPGTYHGTPGAPLSWGVEGELRF